MNTEDAYDFTEVPDRRKFYLLLMVLFLAATLGALFMSQNSSERCASYFNRCLIAINGTDLCSYETMDEAFYWSGWGCRELGYNYSNQDSTYISTS